MVVAGVHGLTFTKNGPFTYGILRGWEAVGEHTQSVSLTEGTKYREDKVVHLHRLLTLALQASLLHTPYVWVVRDRDQGWCT